MSEDGAAPDCDPVEDFEDLYENAPCGYLLLRFNGRIFKTNATFARWLDYSNTEVVGQKLADFLGIAGRIYYDTHLAPLVALQGHFDEVALDLVAKNGESVPVLVSAVAKIAADGEHLFTRLTLFNATERRRYERNLRKAVTTAQTMQRKLHELHSEVEANLLEERKASALREQFIAVLGHDLRNPLAGISGGVSLMMRRGISDERRATLGKMVATSATRMAGLIEDTMDFARSRFGGGLTLDRSTDKPLEPLLRQVVAELQLAAPERAIDVHIAITSPVDCDGRRIAQMVSNLLGNALTHGNAPDPIEFKATTEGGWLQISVANTGAPIPAAMMERLFEPFVRGEHRPGLQGLGLGLYISHQIALAHGGTIDVVSTNAETRFTFTMPLPSLS